VTSPCPTKPFGGPFLSLTPAGFLRPPACFFDPLLHPRPAGFCSRRAAACLCCDGPLGFFPGPRPRGVSFIRNFYLRYSLFKDDLSLSLHSRSLPFSLVSFFFLLQRRRSVFAYLCRLTGCLRGHYTPTNLAVLCPPFGHRGSSVFSRDSGFQKVCSFSPI